MKFTLAKKISCLFLLLSALAYARQGAGVWDTYPDTWAACDDLGRVLPDNSQTGGPRADKKVILFYYIWHGPHGYGKVPNPK